MGPCSMLHMDMSFGQIGMCLILLPSLREQCLFNRFMVCCLESGKDKSTVRMHLQQRRAHGIPQSF